MRIQPNLRDIFYSIFKAWATLRQCCFLSFLQSLCPNVYRKIYTPVMYDPVYTEDVRWNFEKFLIGPDGRPIYRYAQTVDPRNDTQLKADIMAELKKLSQSASSIVG